MLDFRVLFVDDNSICNLETCCFLRESGFNIVPAYCASEAFEFIDKHERLSALVTDIDLGPGPDGFDLARHARAAYLDLPVVYISGTAWRRYETEGVEGSQFISKPFHPRQVVEALNCATRLEVA
jgi:CheY-like chemotaxis protein